MSSKPQKKEVNIVRLMVYLPEKVHTRLRHVAIDKKQSATRLVQGLIEEYLAKERKRKGVK